MNSTLLAPAAVTLPKGHPGEGDPAYIARRRALSSLVASVDELGASLPDVQYTEAETGVWRAVMDRLSNLHESHAASAYLAGFRRLGLLASHPPVPGSLAERLRQETGFGLVHLLFLIQNYLSSRQQIVTVDNVLKRFT